MSNCQSIEKNTEPSAVSINPGNERVDPIQKLTKQDIEFNFNNKAKADCYKNTTNLDSITFGEINELDISQVAATKGPFVESIQNVSVDAEELKKPSVNKTQWIFSLTFDNDIFANRDFYFTNGFKLELSAPFLNKSPINKILIGSKNSNIEQSGFSFVQNIYTPIDIEAEEILYGDRPFSAYLTIGQFRETYNFIKKTHIKSELNFGVIGPSSYGREVQSSIHESEPHGWINQIENDIVISYSIRIDKGIVSSPFFELNTSGRATVGTLYNKAGGGFNLRLGNFMPVYKGPYSTFNNKNPNGRYQFWIFAETMLDVIGYDATLQGGMFNKTNPYVISSSNLNRFVFEASLGFALCYNNIGIEYKHFYLTPEFKGAYHFGWGQLKCFIAF